MTSAALYNQTLLTNFQRDRLSVVLVSPRNPLNIGAAARAMANFGFDRLTVVAPYEEHWREARSAVGAEDLLRHAKVTESLKDAIADSTLVVGTGTSTRRRPKQRQILLPDLAPFIQHELAHGGRVALVFGSEKHGLTRDDFALCHILAEIPTDSRQPSMNLGQAVAVCLYELVRSNSPNIHNNPTSNESFANDSPTNAISLASAHELDLLATVVEESMQAANYSPATMRKANRHDLDILLRRLSLRSHDARRILGIFRRILWRLEKPRNPGG